MRELVKDTIKENFLRGLDETDVSYLKYDRSEELKGVGVIDGFDAVTDIDAFLDCLTDKELLIVLDAQACQRYR